MEQNAETGGGGPAAGPGDAQVGAASAAMTYANLETLTRLNTEELTSILSSTGHHAHHHHRHEEEEEEDGTHYADASANGDGEEPAGYIVTTATEAYHQGSYVVTAASSADTAANNGGGGGEGGLVDDQSTTDNEASGLSVHSYCKPSNSQEAVEGRTSTGPSDVVPTRSSSSVNATAAELLDLKTVLPGPTTRRVLLIDDGHGDLEMAKSDVEFLLRGDAAGIVLREGKRSEVWARFGKVTFQGRKVKGYVACIYCRQVYAFGDAHSTGTSTLKKHRCLAQSLVTTTGASPLTPTSGGSDRLMPSPAPGSSSQSDQQQNASYVNFPSPSVIVSIATAVRSSTDAPEQIPLNSSPHQASMTNIVTRFLAPGDRDELIRNAGVVLGSGSISAASFLQLSKALVELGAKHGVPLVDDMSAIFTSPSFETILPSIAHEYRNHFAEEARTISAGGIGLIIRVQPGSTSRAQTNGQLVQVTLGISYCVDSNQNGTDVSPFLRQVPLRHVQLSVDQDTSTRIGQLVQRTLKEERLDHLRRAIVCNSIDVIKESFAGQMTVPCAHHSIGRALALAQENCASSRQDWRNFHDAIQKMANIVQAMGWETQLAKAIQPIGGAAGESSTALDWMELVINVSSQIGELCKFFQDPSVSSVWNQLDRQLLGHLAAFYSSMASVVAKISGLAACPTLCNVLLARSHVMSLCTPKCHVDPPALSALKHALLEALNGHWPLELAHRLACVLHPAFKHMRRLDVSDRERMETYAMVRNLLRQADSSSQQPVSEHILRSTLDNAMAANNRNGELKRKMSSRTVSNETTPTNSSAAKRQRSSMQNILPTTSTTAPLISNNNDMAFDFSELADFSLHCESANGLTLVPEQRDELDLYLEEKVIQQDLMELTNVLVYWKHRQSVFPGLSQLAFWLLALPSSASSVVASSKSDAVLHRQLFQVVAQSSSSTTTLVE
ncbi:uncharacterized protein LOC130692429 [Daphnia carinata]|uniref:uncharacterized protein LOC130692429 n=1 Tax=Daphnia carinata TaxID=120202 RepID=UPI00257B39AB|nr:uncharacterized protein LOC130692429 [Daphnia carinata]